MKLHSAALLVLKELARQRFVPQTKGTKETVRNYFLHTIDDFQSYFADWLNMEQKGNFEKMRNSYIRYRLFNLSFVLHTNFILLQRV